MVDRQHFGRLRKKDNWGKRQLADGEEGRRGWARSQIIRRRKKPVFL
jgi:hypothetical protein